MHLYTVAIDPYFASTITEDVYAENKEKALEAAKRTSVIGNNAGNLRMDSLRVVKKKKTDKKKLQDA